VGPVFDDDIFGFSVSVSGDTVVAGAPYRYGDGGIVHVGAAYVFERNLGGTNKWGQRAKLLASDHSGGDYFGMSVAVSGNTMVIGAPGVTVDRDPRGAAYVFEYDPDDPAHWREVAKLVSPDWAHCQSFGYSVAVSGDTVVVGDPENYGGRVDVFSRNWGGPDNWGAIAALQGPGGRHGEVVSVRNGRALIGNRSHEAYIFEQDVDYPAHWILGAMLSSAEWGSIRVSIDGDFAVVGNRYHENDRGGLDVYLRSQDGTWGHSGILTASDGEPYDGLGSVSIDGMRILAGAPGDVHDFGVRGSAYVFSVLVPCQPGTYSESGGEPCAPCAPGMYQPDAGQTQCVDCMPGTFQADPGQATCVPCPSGEYASTPGSTGCNPCPGGASNPCYGHGLCDDGDGDGTCVCDTGFVGADCSTALCGNGVIDDNTAEQCDDGAANSNVLPDACREDCTLPRCGDGVVDFGEQCDGASEVFCPGACRDDCQCDSSVPAASGWGMAVFALFVLTLAKLRSRWLHNNSTTL